MEILKKHKEKILLLFILLVASFLRLYRISDYMTFLGDEGRDVLVVYNILHGKFTLLGPTSSVGGFFLGPIYYYFMTPFLWLFHYDPAGPAVMVGLFGVATVWLVLKVGSEFFGRSAGFIAAILYAISPLVIGYSRSSWNPNPMPFFSLLILYLLYKAFTQNSKKLFVISGMLYGIVMQLHYIELFLGVVIFAFVLLSKIVSLKKNPFSQKISIILKDYGNFFLGFLIGFSPFLAFEVKHGFPNERHIVDFVLHSGDTGGNTQFFTTISDVYFRLFGRLVTAYPPSFLAVSSLPTNIFFWHTATLVLAITSSLLLIYEFVKSWQKKSKNFYMQSMIFLWFFFGVILFGFYKKSIYDYYFEFMFPLPFLLVGNLLSFLGRKGFALKIISFVVIGVLLYTNLLGVPFRFGANKQKDQAEKIAAFVISKTNNKPFNFALITGGNSDHAYRYFFTIWGQTPVTIQNVQVDPKRETATDQLLVVCESLPCFPLGDSLWEIAGFGRAEVVGQWDVSVVKVYKLVHYVGK